MELLNEFKDFKCKKAKLSFTFITFHFISGLSLKWEEADAGHCLFVKKYKSSKQTNDIPFGKTIQIFNIPPYVSELTLKQLFEVAGKLERVILFDTFESIKNKFETESQHFDNKNIKNFKIAYLVYKKLDSVDLILNLEKLAPLSTLQIPVINGVNKWTKSYNDRIVEMDEIQKEVDEFMIKYDKIKSAEKDYPDEDDEGWTVVSKKGHNAGFKQKESIITKLGEKMQKQKKQAQLKNFYTFEVRESKKQQLIELRRKFEGDKQKMESMKQSRRFRPF